MQKNQDNEDRRYYIYRHITPSGKVFYIGKGKIGDKHMNSKNNRIFYTRAYSLQNRNIFWHNTVNKYGYEVQIITKNLTSEEAFEIEIDLISWYGRKDLKQGDLVNQTNGGEGRTGMTEEERQNIRDRVSGENSFFYGKPKTQAQIEARQKMKGENHPLYGTKRPLHVIEAIRQAQTGRKHSQESKNKKAETVRKNKSNIGERHPQSKKVYNIDTGEIYSCIREAAEENNIKVTTLKWNLSGKLKNNKYPLLFLNEYLDKKLM